MKNRWNMVYQQLRYNQEPEVQKFPHFFLFAARLHQILICRHDPWASTWIERINE